MNADLDVNWQTEKPNGQPRRCVSIEKAKKEIGFQPKTFLEDGLKKTINWYQSKFGI